MRRRFASTTPIRVKPTNKTAEAAFDLIDDFVRGIEDADQYAVMRERCGKLGKKDGDEELPVAGTDNGPLDNLIEAMRDKSLVERTHVVARLATALDVLLKVVKPKTKKEPQADPLAEIEDNLNAAIGS